MTKKQLNKEYIQVMLEVDQAYGRKEAIRLIKKANSIRKKLYKKESTFENAPKY